MNKNTKYAVFYHIRFSITQEPDMNLIKSKFTVMYKPNSTNYTSQ